MAIKRASTVIIHLNLRKGIKLKLNQKESKLNERKYFTHSDKAVMFTLAAETI